MMMLIAQPSIPVGRVGPGSIVWLENVLSQGDVVEVSDHLAFRSFVGPL